MSTQLSQGVTSGSQAKRPPKLHGRRAVAPSAARPEAAAAPTEEQIARRAYEIYEARGDSGGDALSDWLTAERELRERTEAAACTPTRTEHDVHH